MKHSYYSTLFVLALVFSSAFSYANAFSRKCDSIQIYYDKQQLVLPGESFKIGVISFHEKGEVKRTYGMKGGSVNWTKYNTKIVGGVIDKGRITVNEELIPSKGNFVSLKIWPKKRPLLAKVVHIPLNYETKAIFNPDKDFAKAPGCSLRGEIIFEFDNGVKRNEKISSLRKVLRNYEIEYDGIKLKNGEFVIEPRVEEIDNHTVGLRITSERNPEIFSTYSVQLDYKHNYQLNLLGKLGENGFNGKSANNQNNGSYGSNGTNGSPGDKGPEISVRTDMYYDSVLQCNLLYVIAKNMETEEAYKYLVNPEGGSISINSQGGNGGNGGNGGAGAHGRRGASGKIWYDTETETRTESGPSGEEVTKTYTVKNKHQEPGEDGGAGGAGGDAGNGGDGGSGGDIYLFYTHDAWKFADKIVANSVGGKGGNKGKYGTGGFGGEGGSGDPNGNRGRVGEDGISGFNGNSGRDGNIYKDSCKEFFIFDETSLNSK